MKKSILLMFVVILAIAFVFVWAWAKDTDQSKQTGKATAIQPTEQNKVTPELIQVRPKANMMTDLSQLPQVKNDLGKVADEAGPEIARKPMAYCEVQMFNAAALFRFTNRWIYNPYVPDAFVTLQDPKTPFLGPCPAPQFPFKITDVSMSFRTFGTAGNSCTSWVHGVVYLADNTDPSCPVPGALVGRTADIMIVNPVNYSFNYLLNQPLLDTVCVYGSWFAGYVWDSIPDLDPLMGYSPRFNTTGTTCFDYEDYGGGWYDFGAYASAGPTAFWSSGYVKDQNGCLPDIYWFWKNSYTYAPCGLPDFEQYDHGFPNNGDAYCGPTAEANCLWWMWARGAIPRFWGGVPGDLDWPNLAMQIAALAQTNPITGTECDKLFAANEQLRKQIPLWVKEQNVYSPAFDLLDGELRKSEDVILLLGFWYEDPLGSGIWKRFGGHFVTMTGVNTGYQMMAISDPAFDNAETGAAGFVCHTDPWPHVGNPLVHDNPANASKDVFIVAPSPSPGGIIGLPDYWFGRESQMLKFQGQNFRTVHLPNQGPVPPPGTPVFTEIEQAIIISPASKFETGQVDGSHSIEINNNHGGIEGHAVDFGAGLQSSLYYGTFALGNSDTTMSADYGDYHTDGLHFTPITHPDLQSFNVSGAAGTYTIQQLTNTYSHHFIAGLDVAMYSFGFWVPVGGTDDCEYVIEDIWVVTNNGVDPVLGLDAAVFGDYDVGGSDSVDFDQQHQSIWIYDKATPGAVFGITKKPAVVGDLPVTGYGWSNFYRVYPTGTTGGGYMDSLYSWMHLGWGMDAPYDDMSIIIGGKDFDLAPGAVHMEKYIKWGYPAAIAKGGDVAWRKFLYNVLHQEGYYRGDVNKDGKFLAADIIYAVNYTFKGGPKAIEFADQGDVNGDGSITGASDIIYMVNYQFKGGPAPIDRNRFLADPNNFVDPAHRGLGVRNPGLFGEADWKGLGQ